MAVPDAPRQVASRQDNEVAAVPPNSLFHVNVPPNEVAGELPNSLSHGSVPPTEVAAVPPNSLFHVNVPPNEEASDTPFEHKLNQGTLAPLVPDGSGQSLAELLSEATAAVRAGNVKERGVWRTVAVAIFICCGALVFCCCVGRAALTALAPETGREEAASFAESAGLAKAETLVKDKAGPKEQTEIESGAKKEAEQKAREEAEQNFKWEAEQKAIEQAKRMAMEEAEQKARQVADENSKKDAEQKTKEKAEQKGREAAEQKVREEAEQRARMEAAQKAEEEAERKAKQKVQEAAEQKAKEETEQRAREEAEQKAREAAEQKAREEAEQRARLEAEQKAREAAEQKAREEAEQRAREEADQNARKEAERIAQEVEQTTREEAEQKAKDDAARRAREEAEQKSKDEAEQRVREEAERMAKEEAERKIKERDEAIAKGKADAHVVVFPKYNQALRDFIANECFEHDWSFIVTKPGVLPEDEDELGRVEDAVRQHYVWVMSLYRRLSTKGVKEGGVSKDEQGVFGVHLRDATLLLGSSARGINLLDETEFTKAKVEFFYKASLLYSQEERARLAVYTGNKLARHQFAEWLLRVARGKYPADRPSVAVDKLLQALSTLCIEYSQDVRQLFEAGSADVVTVVLEEHKDDLETVYLMTATAVTQAKESFVSIGDWQKLLKQTKVYIHYPGFKIDDASYAYRLGLTTCADEQYRGVFQQMSFLEFQRAIGAMLFLSEFKSVGACSSERLAELIGEYADIGLSEISAGSPQVQRTRSANSVGSQFARVASTLSMATKLSPSVKKQGTLNMVKLPSMGKQPSLRSLSRHSAGSDTPPSSPHSRQGSVSSELGAMRG